MTSKRDDVYYQHWNNRMKERQFKQLHGLFKVIWIKLNTVKISNVCEETSF